MDERATDTLPEGRLSSNQSSHVSLTELMHDRLRLWRAVIVVYAVYGVNDVFVANSLKVNPNYAVALHEVFGARDFQLVGAVQRVGVRRGAHREPPQIVAPAVEAGEADTSNSKPSFHPLKNRGAVGDVQVASSA